MKRKGLSRRLLSVLLTLVMLLSMLPQVVFAADPTPKTFKKVTSAKELVTGQYVLVDEKGVSPKELSGGWVITTKAVTVDGDTATASEGIWTITVSADGVVLTDANGKSIAPSGGNTNGIKSASYKWLAAFANGTFTFSGQGADTVKLAGNTSSENKYKAYKNTTISGNPNGYPCNFTLYKLEEALSRPSGVISDLSMLENGDKVVIFNPSANMALSVNSAGKEFYRAGVAVTLENTNHLTGYGDTELWTVGIKDGKYTFTSADGKKLSMGDSYASIPLNDVNTEWNIESAATEGCFYIKNAVRDNYLEWFADKNNFSTLPSIGDNEALCAMKLFLVTDAGGSDPEPEPTAVPISDALAGNTGTQFTVKGVVTFTDGSNVYLQDATGGICLYLSAADDNI